MKYFKAGDIISIRKRVLKKISVIGFSLLFFMGLLVLQAQAAVFNPGCTEAELRTAINTANGNAEADIINLPVGCTITLTATENPPNDGNNGLPSIISDIIINGNGGTIQRSAGAEDSFRIFHIAASGDLTLNNVTIQNGYNPGYGGGGIFNLGTLNINDSTITNNTIDDSWGGGGVYNEGAATIINSTISDNTTNYGGGGIRISSGTLNITDSTISGNVSGYGGGGISGNNASGGSITITGSTITNNEAGPGGIGGGGGVSLNRSGAEFVLIENTIISGNTSRDSGGGISHNNSSTSAPLTVNNCTISDNETTDSGGGISSVTYGSASLTITNTTFSANRATYAGGGVHTDSLFRITASTFSGNISGYNNPKEKGGGGAINFKGSAAVGDVINSTFANNTAGLNGGGVRNAGTTNFTNCTFSGNSAPNEGGGVYDDGVTNMQNTIVAGSLGSGNCSGTINDLGTNLSDDGVCGFGPGDNTDPMLDPAGLQDNGGPTPTIGLLLDSPAINGAADCAGLTVDQRGMPRPVGGACDIGAFEVQSISPVPVPTLSEWGMIIMSLMMAAAAILMIRKRRVS